MLQFGIMFELTREILSPFWRMFSSDDKKIDVWQIPFKEELMTASLFFQEKLMCTDVFIIIYWIAFILELIDLMKGCKIMAEEYNGSPWKFVASLLLTIIRTGFFYGLYMQKTDYIQPWIFVNELTILY